jgi:galactose mutarotase-like enzyme
MNTNYTVSNKFLTCTINSIGAEITSLRSKPENIEYIWQADPDTWAGSAPILFPIVGRLNKGKYSIDGQEYVMNTHGFIKEQNFNLIDKTETSIRLRSSSNGSTMQHYPFRYDLDVIFSLTETSLTVTYVVVNRDKKDLYYAIGSHPAFALDSQDLQSGKYHLTFSEQESEWCQLIENDLLSSAKHNIKIPNKTLLLTTNLFDNDALIFRDVSSSSITLSKSSEPILSVNMGTNKHLGLWAKPNAPYVCIEPWTSTDESITTPLELKEKADMLCVKPDAKCINFYSINIYY